MTEIDYDNDGDVEDVEDDVNDVNYFIISVNGEEVWRSEGAAMLVDKVTINNARGEVTVVGSANQDTYLEITVNERSENMPVTYLDIEEANKAQERRDKYEPEPDKTREGYVEADPETGEPMEETRVPTQEEKEAEEKEEKEETAPEPDTQEEQDRENAMAGDVEF